MKSKPSALLLGIGVLWAVHAEADSPVDFNRDIRPLLSKHCLACHGPDEAAREASLRLDSATGATADLGGYRAVQPGEPDHSELITRIESDDPDTMMPPADSGHALSEKEKRSLRQWIASGAEYQAHWAFVPPHQTAPPPVQDRDWPRNPIDYFILQQLEANGLSPSPPLDRLRLLRRVSLDLTGLPPTVAEADAFLADDRSDAYASVVDRLLGSDAYGEHWARMWLDLARYADTKGYEKDLPRQMWRYRDWVIEALNQDMPYDQFSRDQLAGDLLPDATPSQILATAFHRNTMTNDEGGTDNEEFRVAAVKDRVDTTLQVWMGLTMGCAKCHSHKYDPISQADYYSTFALFNQTEDTDRSDDAPLLASPTPSQAAELAELDAKIAALQEGGKETDELATLQARQAAIQKTISKIPVMRELPSEKSRETRIHVRGNFLSPGELVAPAVPEVFGPFPQDAPRNRLGMTHWLMQPANPLTSRVMVNRIWARLFGVGLVETEEDFGTQGLLPTHPELLDWMAVEFRENGWSMKQLIRSIVMSATYRQASRIEEKSQTVDPRNRLLSHGPRIRLSAERLRDQALAASGLLTHHVGGESVMPPQPAGVWKTTYNTMSWQTDTGPNRYRRGLYTFWKRTSPYPANLTFDAGSGEVCLIRRIRTNTPLQALVTLNDTVYVEAAGGLAKQMQAVDGNLSEKITIGFRRLLTRSPETQELQRLEQLYESLITDFRDDPEAAAALLKAAGRSDASTAEEAAFVAVANVLLNLDETLMRP